MDKLWCSVVLIEALILFSAQCLPVSGQTNSSSPLSSRCVNGVFLNESMRCECFTGWSGENCSSCRGRLKLTESRGIISDSDADVATNYTNNAVCLFYIEANESVASIHLKVQFLHLECQWDYVYVFDGDSIFAPKIAAYTGNIIEDPSISEEMMMMMEANSTYNNDTEGPILNPQHELVSSGSTILLYFYTDLAAGGPGFRIAYWVDFSCPDFCSERGVCDSSTGLCSCDIGWSGDACHVPDCPNNCSSDNGICDTNTMACICNQGYLGDDCSILEISPHWSVLPHLPLTARGSMRSVIWNNQLYLYGGYQFPSNGGYYSNRSDDNGGGGGGSVLKYSFGSHSVEVLNTSSLVHEEIVVRGQGSGSGDNDVITTVPRLPALRYGHTAVLYNDLMVIFGGSLYPSETITSELWTLNLTSLQWTPLFDDDLNNGTVPLDRHVLPITVTGHSAHVIGSKMVVIFGLSSGDEIFSSRVQEYDFISGVWSLPRLCGVGVAGRVGHSSSYYEEDGLVYVYGGRNYSLFFDDILSYNPVTYVWAALISSGSERYLHDSIFLGPLLVSFGGCQDGQDCFSSDLLLYHPACNTLEKSVLPGLPPNASRYGHHLVLDPLSGSVLVFGGFIGTFHEDVLMLEVGNCSILVEELVCVYSSYSLCAWEGGRCVPVSQVRNLTCSSDSCSVLNQSMCSSNNQCLWDASSSLCSSSSSSSSSSNGVACPQVESPLCSNHTSCPVCQLQGCYWGRSLNETAERCFSENDLDDPSLNISEVSSCSDDSCFSLTSCAECTPRCLWCPSLSRCVPSKTYPIAFNYGQCLGWVSEPGECLVQECTNRRNCSSCQEAPQCGWCNGPSDTGLGECIRGGFSSPLENTTCLGTDSLGNQEEWQFYQCSACQCNGHSVCSNGSSVCEQCMNNTSGRRCESCSLGYFGDASNGGSCDECECNGYDFECDVLTGVCTCQSLGVSGDNCTICSSEYANGDADNFCYADLPIDYIYKFDVNEDNQVQGFYACTPPRDESLHFNFNLLTSRDDDPVTIQLFLGRKSENLWVLSNLTEVVTIAVGESFDRRFDNFDSPDNRSFSSISSFVHLSIRETFNFSTLFDEAVDDDYTRHMWDGDVTLVLHVTNLTAPSSLRITVDQQNYIILLYFFLTFITCFSVFLTAILLVWYIRKKIMYRLLVRQQYIELQRRVARPFAKILLAVGDPPPPSSSSSSSSSSTLKEHSPSYVAVETCRNEKAAVLSLLVQLPRNEKTGRTTFGRTGLCVGSTLVYVNSSKKPKLRKREGAGEGHGGGHGQGEENAFVVRTNRRRTSRERSLNTVQSA